MFQASVYTVLPVAWILLPAMDPTQGMGLFERVVLGNLTFYTVSRVKKRGCLAVYLVVWKTCMLKYIMLLQHAF